MVGIGNENDAGLWVGRDNRFVIGRRDGHILVAVHDEHRALVGADALKRARRQQLIEPLEAQLLLLPILRRVVGIAFAALGLGIEPVVLRLAAGQEQGETLAGICRRRE